MSVDHADQGYFAAVRAGDEEGAQAVADRVLESDGVAGLVGLVGGAQLRVGELWSTNVWTVPDEHRATAVSEAVLQRALRRLDPPHHPSGPLLVACAEREFHALPALLVTVSLRASGQDAEYLGSSTTRDGLVGRVLDTGARAVLLSATLSSSLFRVRRQVEAIRGTGTPVVVGGTAFDTAGRRAQAIGATAYATGLVDLPGVLAALPQHTGPAPTLRHAGAQEANLIISDLHEMSREVLLGTDAALGEGATALPADHWRTVLATFVPHLLECVAGAVLTEDPTVTHEARAWMTAVLTRREAPPEAMDCLWEVLGARLREYPRASATLAGG
jgi:methanogenic corrinoid protein MtbC1